MSAELSFANQNVSRYEFESEALNISHYQKRAMVLMVIHMIIRNFDLGEKPLSSEEISRKLKIPVRLARDVLEDLTGSGLVSVIHEHEDKMRSYQPAIDINKITISFVLNRIEKKGTYERYAVKSREYERVAEILDKYEKLTSASDSNILIKDL